MSLRMFRISGWKIQLLLHFEGRLGPAGTPGQLGRHQDGGIEGQGGVCEDAWGGGWGMVA